MVALTQIYSIVRKDLSQIARNRTFLATTLFAILFNMLLPYIMTFQVNEIRVTVVSHDPSVLAGNLIRGIRQSPQLVLISQEPVYERALATLNNGDADCIVEIPKDYERNFILASLNGSKIPQIQVSADAVNTTKAMFGTQYVIGTIGRKLQEYASDKGLHTASPSQLITSTMLYNPYMSYMLLMIPVLFISILFVVNTSTRLMTNEYQSGTISQIIVSPMSSLTFTVGKLVVAYVVSMFAILLTMSLLFLCFRFWPAGSLASVFIALSLYVLSVCSVGFLLCNVSANITQMFLYCNLFSLFAQLMSGYITPIESMAPWADYLSYILPTRYVIQILRNVELKGATFFELYHLYAPLAMIFVISFILSVTTFKRSRD